MLPLASVLVLKTHLQPIAFIASLPSTSVHTSFFFMDCSSSSIACIQESACSLSIACWNVLGSFSSPMSYSAS
ncbi:hypothetical protein RchiOBHm_Chr3g0467141 [Rosa chinensis]|uniref:Uncharacterized protein n=1 Tax=Rosa chinensis TaxID=74649 RepID=A0A2P6RA61_ROSCH|nr:hypothetical protein RchiOBHm_Chr3g0467141 [Rosa chinensis]